LPSKESQDKRRQKKIKEEKVTSQIQYLILAEATRGGTSRPSSEVGKILKMMSDMQKAKNVITTMLDILEQSLNTSGQVNKIIVRKMERLQRCYDRFADLFYETEFEEDAATEFEEVSVKFSILRARIEVILVPAAPPTTQRSDFEASSRMEQMLNDRELGEHGDAPAVSKGELEEGRGE
jgi:hypothetical protein